MNAQRYDGSVLVFTLELTREQAAALGAPAPEGMVPLVTLAIDTGRDEFRELLRSALTNKGGKATAGALVVRRGGRA